MGPPSCSRLANRSCCCYCPVQLVLELGATSLRPHPPSSSTVACKHSTTQHNTTVPCLTFSQQVVLEMRATLLSPDDVAEALPLGIVYSGGRSGWKLSEVGLCERAMQASSG